MRALFSVALVLGVRGVLPAQADRWNDLMGRIAQLTGEGRIAEALPVTTELLSVAEKTFGKAHANDGMSLNAVGCPHLLAGKYQTAEDEL